MTIDSDNDIESLKKIGSIVSETLRMMMSSVVVGMTTKELDKIGENNLTYHGAQSAPRISYNFPGATCISINEEVAHGIPGDRLIKAGDVVNIDVSAELNGYFADTGGTILVPKSTPQQIRLCHATRLALVEAIKCARNGLPINGIGSAIERVAKMYGFRTIHNLGSHGVGRSLHEEPKFIQGYSIPEDTRKFEKGMVITIEPFLSTKSRDIIEGEDGWTLLGARGNFSAQYEHTMIITDNDPIIVT